MITIIITNDYYILSLLVIVRGRTSISIVICPPLFLHKMYTFLLLYEMLMSAGNKLNWIELSDWYTNGWYRTKFAFLEYLGYGKNLLWQTHQFREHFTVPFRYRKVLNIMMVSGWQMTFQTSRRWLVKYAKTSRKRRPVERCSMSETSQL